MNLLPEKLDRLLSGAADGIIMIDEEDRLVFINRTAQNIFQLNEDSYSGELATSVITQSNFSELLENMLGASFCQDEISSPDGKVYNAHLSRIPNAGAVIILQDITELKELNRIKSEFVATVSHDLRSPLTAILGYTELIDRVGTINEQQREFIRRIQFSINNITNLINDLLDLGRIEAGLDSHKEMVSLNSIIRYAVEGLRSRVEEKKQVLYLQLDDRIPDLLGSPIRLRQMASNLIGNAVKYTPLGGQIWVRTRSEANMLILQVQDTGPGIPTHEQPKVFNRFYRGTNVPLEIPGTGLGLAIVKSIAENHQGRVWVDSTLGVGSIFTVVLPVMDVQAQSISPTQTNRAISQPER
jgi:two-component system, OmpR family, phosphate regulon sensor histidine kinase PhoR